jgi:hypothetical protein
VNKCKEIAKLLTDGNLRNVEQVAQALGMTYQQAMNAIGHGVRCGYILPLYGVSERGIAFASKPQRTPAEKREAANQLKRDKRRVAAIARAEARKLAEPDAEERVSRVSAAQVVESAMQSRHPLQMAWSVAA